jgi:hypothetical protein
MFIQENITFLKLKTTPILHYSNLKYILEVPQTIMTIALKVTRRKYFLVEAKLGS